LISALEPYREKAKELSDDLIMDVIIEGSRVARERAEETVEEVRRVLWSGS
jgi:hypothetical protein